MGRLSNAERHQAISMIEGGMSYHAVARRVNCAHSTIIMRLVERQNLTGSVERPGRQRVTSRQQDRHIILTHLRDRFRTLIRTARETAGLTNQLISASTVRRRLREREVNSYREYIGNILTPRMSYKPYHMVYTPP